MSRVDSSASNSSRSSSRSAVWGEGGEVQEGLLSDLGHELRTPLNGVLGMAELLMDEELAPRAREYALTIRRGAEALRKVIDGHLENFESNPEAGPPARVEFDPRALMEHLAELAAPSAAAQGLEFVLGIEPQLPEKIRSDERRLRRAVSCVLDHALKFTSTGRIQLLAGSLKQVGETRLVIEVLDPGPGLAPEDRDRVLPPFLASDDGLAGEWYGAGLGLARAREWLRALGGTLEVARRPGGGARFVITVPVEVTKAAPGSLGIPELVGAPVVVWSDGSIRARILVDQLTFWGCVAWEVEELSELSDLMRRLPEGSEGVTVVVDGPVENEAFEKTVQRVRGVCRNDETAVVFTHPPGEAHFTGAVSPRFVSWVHQPVRRDALASALSSALAGETAADVAPGLRAVGTALSGVRALVADDNPVNRRLLSDLLQNWGCRVVLAADGAEAVACFAACDFDIVLMDVQMPGMDGYEATKRIRALESSSGGRVPVVAVTAHVGHEHRRYARNTDMDEHLPKPVLPDSLYALMVELARSRGMGGKPESLDPVGAVSIFDWEHFHLMSDGPGELADELLSHLKGGLVEDLEAIDASRRSGDWVAVSGIAHKLKGSCQTLGANALAELLESVERSGRKKDLDSVPSLLIKARVAANELLVRLAQGAASRTSVQD